jgi:hypothetical protein
MLFLTGYHRSGTSAIYYDLIRRTNKREFLPPARAVARLLETISAIRTHDSIFLPRRSSGVILKETFLSLIREVYGRTDNLFLKSTDFIAYIEDILEICPDGQMIIVMRDPVAIVSSLLSARKLDQISEELREAAIRQICDDLCSKYNQTVTSHTRHKGRLIWIRYEDYVRDPDRTADRISSVFDGFFSFSIPGDELKRFEGEFAAFCEELERDPYWSGFLTEYTRKPVSLRPAIERRPNLRPREVEFISSCVGSSLDPELWNDSLYSR